MNGTEYPKIDSIYKRDKKGKFLIGEFSRPEFEYLADKPWLWTEKVDGTNIRLSWGPGAPISGNEVSYISGRTDNAQIPPKLLKRLVEIHKSLPWGEVFHTVTPDSWVVLYGEGYGAGIQKGGGNYRPDQDFVLFDVRVGSFWLSRDNVVDVANKMDLDVVQRVVIGTVSEAIEAACSAYASYWPGVLPEGLVGRPLVDLYTSQGSRVTTKVKAKDFE